MQQSAGTAACRRNREKQGASLKQDAGFICTCVLHVNIDKHILPINGLAN